jgi:hypothetical protein
MNGCAKEAGSCHERRIGYLLLAGTGGRALSADDWRRARKHRPCKASVLGHFEGSWSCAPEHAGLRPRGDWRNAVKMAPITLHECRHTFASLMIAAGVNAKALST